MLILSRSQEVGGFATESEDTSMTLSPNKISFIILTYKQMKIAAKRFFLIAAVGRNTRTSGHTWLKFKTAAVLSRVIFRGWQSRDAQAVGVTSCFANLFVRSQEFARQDHRSDRRLQRVESHIAGVTLVRSLESCLPQHVGRKEGDMRQT